MPDVCLHVDTALSQEGQFLPSSDDVVVEVLTPYGWQIVIVSARYTTPGIEEAATIAADAYHEHEGHTVPWTTFGGPFYHVKACRRGKEPATQGVVRMESDSYDCTWVWQPEHSSP